MWEKKRLLVWGKTYPQFSTKYYETVCTGAVDTETGKLIRIYPITLRYMSEPFSKYEFIEAEIQRNLSDRRPESHKINLDSIQKTGKLDTKDGWLARSKVVLNPSSVFGSVEDLLGAEEVDGTSIGIVAPKTINRFYVQRRPESDRKEWEEQRERAMAQQELFVDPESVRKELNYMPIHYKVEFTCDHAACAGHDCTIQDWEIYALSRKVFARKGAAGAEEDVIKRLNEMCDLQKTKPHLFLGNTLAHPKSFSVVGFFYPKLAAYAKLV